MSGSSKMRHLWWRFWLADQQFRHPVLFVRVRGRNRLVFSVDGWGLLDWVVAFSICAVILLIPSIFDALAVTILRALLPWLEWP